MIYIASPYSHPNDSVQYARFIAARDYTAFLMSQGYVAFSPIAYGRQFEKAHGVKGDHVTWLNFNKHLLRHSTFIHVLKLEGWEKSKGVEFEIQMAKSCHIPIEYIQNNKTVNV